MSSQLPSPTAPPAAPSAPLTFTGGLAGALAPFAAFLGGVAWLALNGAPDEKGFWPILLGALILGLLLAQDRERYADAMLDGMSQRVVMVMLCAWLFAGVMGAVLSAGGLVTGLAWASRTLGLSGGAYVAATFLTTAIVSTATGTSFGTILLCGPILYPAGGAAGAMPAALMGAVLAGSTFGDSMSPVSDTTIASSGTQRVDIGGTVRSRLRYAVPAGLAALVASALLGGGTVVDAVTTTVASAAPSAPTSPKGLVLLISPALVIAMLLRRTHLITALLTGVATSVGIALAFRLVTPYDLLHIAPGTFGANGVLVDGMQRAIGVSVFTLLLVALVGTLQATDVLDRLVRASEQRAHSARAAEGWMVGVVSAAVLLTTHSVVAILAVGEFARQTGERFGIDGYRRANLLDLTVCTWPFLLPYFLPTILTASASRSGEAFGMPPLTAGTVGLYNTYAWALVVTVLLAVITGYGRKRA
ncbi:Na+/H+ antiporter NhaC family protein [Gemmatimonas sp.]|uniref:Na+/H+ antiporter NhaC family protein n=1 Tax=Gemmatimonas sp. TaxID=1962908 RepID=UPI00286A2FA1|nr:Na+/H+ antiporter NhaC family protein [Gemmatimonas sp.]